jgi:hypothetical protein
MNAILVIPAKNELVMEAPIVFVKTAILMMVSVRPVVYAITIA